MSTFRKQYRALTTGEKEHIELIKDAAERLELLIVECTTSLVPRGPEQVRHVVLAMTNLEQAVMWAVKAYT